MRLSIHLTTSITLLFLTAQTSIAEKPHVEASRLNPFFAFDNGTGRGELSPEEQARMLADLGYDGIGYTGTQNIPEMLAALDKHGLKMFSTYVGVTLTADGASYDPNLKEALGALKGRKTIVWLYIRGRSPDAEEQTVRVVLEIGEMAAASGIRVALYPHYGFYVDRIEVALRIAKKVDLKNVGVSFNLCHFLRAGDEANLELRLKQSMPSLFLVSVNGADHKGGWDRLIQPLDSGNYDVYAVLKKLHDLGYRGPIGLQCYKVPGDRRENLKRSMAAWRRFVRRMAAEHD